MSSLLSRDAHQLDVDDLLSPRSCQAEMLRALRDASTSVRSKKLLTASLPNLLNSQTADIDPVGIAAKAGFRVKLCTTAIDLLKEEVQRLPLNPVNNQARTGVRQSDAPAAYVLSVPQPILDGAPNRSRAERADMMKQRHAFPTEHAIRPGAPSRPSGL